MNIDNVPIREYSVLMNYLTTIQVSKKWNISQRRVAVLCSQGRVNGAMKFGKTWLIPDSCDKPADERYDYDIKSNSDGVYASEPVATYRVKTELMLDPVLVRNAEAYFSDKGKSLSEGINDFISGLSFGFNDFRSTYPEGFFNLFGCASDNSFPDSIEDYVPEDVEL